MERRQPQRRRRGEKEISRSHALPEAEVQSAQNQENQSTRRQSLRQPSRPERGGQPAETEKETPCIGNESRTEVLPRGKKKQEKKTCRKRHAQSVQSEGIYRKARRYRQESMMSAPDPDPYHSAPSVSRLRQKLRETVYDLLH